jgi:hypothetical protein
VKAHEDRDLFGWALRWAMQQWGFDRRHMAAYLCVPPPKLAVLAQCRRPNPYSAEFLEVIDTMCRASGANYARVVEVCRLAAPAPHEARRARLVPPLSGRGAAAAVGGLVAGRHRAAT